MYVGVILGDNDDPELTTSIPHVCGGDPLKRFDRCILSVVFPMYVGVIL